MDDLKLLIMEWDCRLRMTKRLNVTSLRPLPRRTFVLSVILVVSSLLSSGQTFYLDCDQVQGAGHCECTKLEQYSVDCPSNQSIYPIQLKLYNIGNPNEAFLEVTCNSGTMEQPVEFQWEQVQGVDLSEDRISAKVVKLSLNRCPATSNGLKGLLSRVNITSSNVQRFTIIYSDTKAIPENYISEFPNLEVLNLSQNQLEELPDLSLLPNLVELNLRNNKIKTIKSDAFSSNTKLKRIVLSHNEIELIPPKAFPNSLEFLDISGRKLTTLTSQSLSNLSNLQRLIIEGAPLRNADPESFDNLTSVKEIFLNQAQFSVFPTLKNLPLLANLSINWIRLDQQPLTLNNLPALTMLKARDSRFTDLPTLSNVTNLRNIDLSRNRIQNLSRAFFAQLPALDMLDLSGNRISELVEIRSPNLVKLSIQNNAITSLQKNIFAHLGKLEELLLSDNKIRDVDYNAFENQGELKRLDLSHNEISFSNSPFKNVPNLDGLGDFSANSFINKCTRLEYLNLSHNQFDKIYDDWKNVFTMLEELDLSYNKIKQLSVVDLQFISVKKLQLNISHNEITKFNFMSSWIFEENDHSSIDIYIDGNPIVCDCFAYLVKSHSSKSHRLHLDNLFCANPPPLQRMQLLRVLDHELLCQLEQSKCPTDDCTCWQRPADTTIVVNCSNLHLESKQLPVFNWSLQNQFNNWGIAFDFSRNEIKELDIGYVSGLILPERVKYVDLSRNRLESIGFMNAVKDNSNLNFSLSYNPFSCESCSDFVVIWATQSSHIVDSENLTCFKRDNDQDIQLTVHNLSELLEDCNVALNTTGIRVLIICVVIFATICIVMIIFMVRYSWVIKAFLFSKGWGCCLFWDSDSEEDDQEKLYDAFVSYSHKDEDWVVDELVNRLETEEGFKLCLHFRDWTPGDWIPDQIVRSVDQSKRTVVILSKNFVESVWSRLEFKAAHAQALSQGSNRVILVLIEDGMNDKDVQDDDLKVYMKMNTYLKWSDPWFWHKLKYALPHRKGKQEENINVLKKMQQREKARELDKIRTKLEQVV